VPRQPQLQLTAAERYIYGQRLLGSTRRQTHDPSKLCCCGRSDSLPAPSCPDVSAVWLAVCCVSRLPQLHRLQFQAAASLRCSWSETWPQVRQPLSKPATPRHTSTPRNPPASAAADERQYCRHSTTLMCRVADSACVVYLLPSRVFCSLSPGVWPSVCSLCACPRQDECDQPLRPQQIQQGVPDHHRSRLRAQASQGRRSGAERAAVGHRGPGEIRRTQQSPHHTAPTNISAPTLQLTTHPTPCHQPVRM